MHNGSGGSGGARRQSPRRTAGSWGDTVLLLHGYAAAKDSMLGPARALRSLGWSSYLGDFRGSGGSAGTDTTIGVHEGRDVAAAWHAARALTGADRPVVVYGASMGAAAALRAIAREGVAPDGLILAAPFDRLLHTVANRFHPTSAPAGIQARCVSDFTVSLRSRGP
ncbi:MAG TPA: alpha/beta fold hydrolase [Longimicrobiales bacterium]|nr:alpha/beta fold hydrolase [Longimicrobiales bacterium]